MAVNPSQRNSLETILTFENRDDVSAFVFFFQNS